MVHMGLHEKDHTNKLTQCSSTFAVNTRGCNMDSSILSVELSMQNDIQLTGNNNKTCMYKCSIDVR